MGSALSSDGRQGGTAAAATGSRPGPQEESIQQQQQQLRGGGEERPQDGPQHHQPQQQQQQQSPSFDCSICLEVLHHPVRTQCGHVFCHSCIATSLHNNAWKCPYCRAYLPSEGIPATDITDMMKNIYQNCTECERQVCLSEMRAHLRTCDQYIEKYGPLQEVAYPETRYPCPFCQYELDENDLLDHFLTYHRSERRQVYCPICRLLPGGGPRYYSRTFMRHLQLRHTFYYEEYIDIDVVEEVLIERVLDQSFLDYVHVNSSNVV